MAYISNAPTRFTTYSHVDTLSSPSLINITSPKTPDIVTFRLASDSAQSQEIPLYTPSNSVDLNYLEESEYTTENLNQPITSPSLALLEAIPSNEMIGLNDEFSVSNRPSEHPESPINSIQSIKQLQISGDNTKSAVGPIPIGSVPAFAPPKIISISREIGQRLGDNLKSTDSDIRQAAVEELERRIIKMQGRCPDDIVNNLRVRTFQLDATLINEYMNQPGIYDHDFQDGMGCLIDALISTDPNDPLPDARLRRWITDINKIGGKSAEGMAFRLKSDNYPLYVIKVASNPTDDKLAHEALVGMGALNTLRDRVPTFMHTYGAFMCSPPVLDENGRVVAWCSAKEQSITYLVLENISDAEPLNDIIKDLTPEEFLQIYLQVLNALNVAYKEFDYTHYDLHASNVLIQTLPYMVSVPLYNPNGGVLYIKTNRLSRIIDFGMSHVYIQGQHFGRFDLEYAGINPDSSFPMHDAYKLLLFSYSAKSSSRIASVVRTIYSFFNENKTLEARIAERSADLWNDYFQPDSSYKSLTLDALILYILDKFAPDDPVIAPIPQDDSWIASIPGSQRNNQLILPQPTNQLVLPQPTNQLALPQPTNQPTVPWTKIKNPTVPWVNPQTGINGSQKVSVAYFISKDPAIDAIATICQDKCIKWDTFNQHVFNRARLPQTLEDYCQSNTAIETLSDGPYKEELRRWLSQFNVEKAYNDEREIATNKLNDNIVKLNGVQLLSVDYPNFNATIYERELKNLVNIRGLIVENIIWITSVICAFNANRNLSSVQDDITQILKAHKGVNDRINELRVVIRYNMAQASQQSIYFNDDVKFIHAIMLK